MSSREILPYILLESRKEDQQEYERPFNPSDDQENFLRQTRNISRMQNNAYLNSCLSSNNQEFVLETVINFLRSEAKKGVKVSESLMALYHKTRDQLTIRAKHYQQKFIISTSHLVLNSIGS